MNKKIEQKNNIQIMDYHIQKKKGGWNVRWLYFSSWSGSKREGIERNNQTNTDFFGKQKEYIFWYESVFGQGLYIRLILFNVNINHII